MNELSREQVEEIAARAALCAEATLPGDQLRALVALALIATPKQTDAGDGPVCHGVDRELTREQVKETEMYRLIDERERPCKGCGL